MVKDTLLIIAIFVLIVGAFVYFQKAQVVSEELKRIVPSEINPEETFEIIYSTNRTGNWGVIIVDNVLGGCKFPNGKTEYKSVMLSTAGNSQIVEITALSSGSCTFHGNYNFGTEAIKYFSDKTVKVK